MDSAAIRARLLERRAEIERLATTAGDAADTVELDQTRVGRLSRMDALQSQAMSRETLRRRAVELRTIDAALERIDNGSYGVCRDCAAPIPERRLEVDPTATRCIACAGAREQR